MYFGARDGVIENITLKNIDFCGKKLTASDKNDSTVIRNNAHDFFGELTIS